MKIFISLGTRYVHLRERGDCSRICQPQHELVAKPPRKIYNLIDSIVSN
jgi:hypothetical protein